MRKNIFKLWNFHQTRTRSQGILCLYIVYVCYIVGKDEKREKSEVR